MWHKFSLLVETMCKVLQSCPLCRAQVEESIAVSLATNVR